MSRTGCCGATKMLCINIDDIFYMQWKATLKSHVFSYFLKACKVSQSVILNGNQKQIYLVYYPGIFQPIFKPIIWQWENCIVDPLKGVFFRFLVTAIYKNQYKQLDGQVGDHYSSLPIPPVVSPCNQYKYSKDALRKFSKFQIYKQWIVTHYCM